MSKKAILIEDNPLIRGSDSHLISPYSITDESHSLLRSQDLKK